MAQVRGDSAYEIAKDSPGNWYKFEKGQEKCPYWIFNRDKKRAYLYDHQQGKLVPLKSDLSENTDSYDENESLLSQIADLRDRIPTSVRRELVGWNVHHDVHAARGSMMRSPAMTQVTKRIAPDGSNLVTVLHTLHR